MTSIIIVGYNSKEDLKKCFDSIYSNTYTRFRVIFIDNGSSDGSLEYIKTNYAQIITIKNKNTGYAGGNNVGIRKAIELKSKYVFLLNPDTIIDKECLSNLIKKADDQAILQPLILLNIDSKNTDLINTTGGHLNFLGFSYCGNYKQNKSVAKEGDIAIASGAAVFIPAVILKKIGLLDESFFMYHEDVDLFWRARIYGFDIRLISNSIVWHKYSFSKNKMKMFYSERNRLLFLHKNFTLKYKILIFPIFLLNELLMIMYSLLNGWLLLKIKTYISIIFILYNSAYKKSEVILWKEKNEVAKRYLVTEINFSEVSSVLFTPYNALTKIYWLFIKWCI